MSIEIIVTHKCCSDGLAAAFNTKEYLTNRGKDPKVIFLSHTGKQIEDLHKHNFFTLIDTTEPVTIHVVDFSFEKETLEAIWSTNPTAKVIVIDHHQTAFDNFEELITHFSAQNKQGIFQVYLDNHLSAAVLTYIHFFTLRHIGEEITRDDTWLEENIPSWLLYIQDRDIWKWKYKEVSEPFTEGFMNLIKPDDLDTLSQNFGVEEKDSKTSIGLFINTGKKLIEFRNNIIENVIGNVEPCQITLGGKVLRGALINSTVFASNLGNDLVRLKDEEGNYKYDFAVIYQNIRGKWKVGLRSRNDLSILPLATHFGGGGHAQACGIPLGTFGKFLDFYHILKNGSLTL